MDTQTGGLKTHLDKVKDVVENALDVFAGRVCGGILVFFIAYEEQYPASRGFCRS